MRRIADLVAHPVEVSIYCGCTRVISTTPEYLLKRLGSEATIEDGERRMICRTCKQRPRLKAKGCWAVTGSRDMRIDPPPIPAWVDLS